MRILAHRSIVLGSSATVMVVLVLVVWWAGLSLWAGLAGTTIAVVWVVPVVCDGFLCIARLRPLPGF